MTIPIRNNYEDRTFAAVRKLQTERRAAMPQSFAGLCDRHRNSGSKLNGPGMTVGPDNRPRRIPNSDPEIHWNSRPVERPLLITTISAEDEPEVPTEDDAVELSLSEPAVEAGDEEPEIEPEPSDEQEGESESESDSEVV